MKKIALIRTQVGTYIGEFSVSFKQLTRPCMVDFIPIPVQGRFAGQQVFAMARMITPWPAKQIELSNSNEYAGSTILEGDDSELLKLYWKTVKEAWPEDFKILDS